MLKTRKKMKDKYVYILMDPTKPAKLSYKNFCLLYEPFYVGKGTGNRINHHLRPYSLKLINRKNGKIKSIIKQGEDIIQHKIFESLDESTSNDLEVKIIKEIGRLDLKVGPLCNHTDGGEGTSGRKSSAKSRLNYKNSKTGEKNPLFGKQNHNSGFTNKELYKSDYKKITQKLISSHIGNKQSEETKEKMKNERSKRSKYKLWRFTDPDGNDYETIGEFKNFCNKHSLPYHVMNRIATRTRKGNDLFWNGWTAELLDSLDKKWEVKSPTGETTIVVNRLKDFCKEKGIPYQTFINTISGKRKKDNTNGWKAVFLGYYKQSNGCKIN